jgi:hypothetical protein
MAVAARECWNWLSRARRWWRPVVREQRRAILPGIVDGSVQFCLELTEPDAGSNLIAISSRPPRRRGPPAARPDRAGERRLDDRLKTLPAWAARRLLDHRLGNQAQLRETDLL